MDDNTKGRFALGCVTLFLLPFAIMSLFVTGIAIREFWFWAESQSWVTSGCIIDRAELEQSDSDGGATYRNVAEYHYEFDHRKYRGSQVSFAVGFDNVGDSHQRAHEELEARRADGRPFPCFVNPKNPAEAVLYRDLQFRTILLLAVSLMFSLGTAGTLALIFRFRHSFRPSK